VPPRLGAADGLRRKERMRHPPLRQNPRLDAALGTDEIHFESVIAPLERLRERERRIEVPAGTATSEEDPGPGRGSGHHTLSSLCRARESRTPTAAKLTMRPLRPYDMNGSVTPVVGSSA